MIEAMLALRSVPARPNAWVLASMGAALAGLAALALAIDPSSPSSAELDVARTIQRVDFPGWAGFIALAEFFSRPLVVGLLGGVAALSFAMRRRWAETALLLGALLVWLPKVAISELVSRDRPTEAALEILRAGDGFAFPSGHTTGAFVVYGAMLLILLSSRHRGNPFCLSGAGLVGLLLVGAGAGRVVLGAHWPSDVLGALLLSVAWLVGLRWAYLRFRPLQPTPGTR